MLFKPSLLSFLALVLTLATYTNAAPVVAPSPEIESIRETGTVKWDPRSDRETGTVKPRLDRPAGTVKWNPRSDRQSGTVKAYPRSDRETGTVKNPMSDRQTGTVKVDGKDW
jgi:hypothetical protein